MKQRSIIDELQQHSQVPDKLQPRCIKELLDEQGIAGGIIREEPPEEIKLMSTRGGIFKTLAVAAAFVLVVGGLAFLKLNNGARTVHTTPVTQPPATADCTGLEGLRGGTYKSLFNFLKDKEDSQNPYGVETLYAYQQDDQVRADQFQKDKQQSDAFRSSCFSGDGAAGVFNMYRDQVLAGSDPEKNSDGSALVVQSNTSVFAAGLDNVYAYRLQGGSTERIDYDFLGQTFMLGLMEENELFQEAEHTPKLYVLDLRLLDNKLLVTYDFHLPEIFQVSGQEKNIMHEYCGVSVFDVSDLDNISLVYEYEQPGLLISAGMTQEGSFHMLSQYRQAAKLCSYRPYTEGSFLPVPYENGQPAPAAEDKIYLTIREDVSTVNFVSSFGLKEAPKTQEEAPEGSRYPVVMSAVKSAVEESALPKGEFYRKGTIIIAGDPGTVICEHGTLLLLNSSSETVKSQELWDDREFYEEYYLQIIEIDTSQGPKLTRALYADQSQVESFELGVITGDTFSEFTHANGFLYLMNEFSDVYILDEDFNVVGGYNAFTPNDLAEESYYLEGHLDGATLYRTYEASLVTGVNDDGSYTADYYNICCESVDMSDPGDIQVTSYPETKVYDQLSWLEEAALSSDLAMSIDEIISNDRGGIESQTLTFFDPRDLKKVTVEGVESMQLVNMDSMDLEKAEKHKLEVLVPANAQSITLGSEVFESDFACIPLNSLYKNYTVDRENGLICLNFRDISATTHWVNEDAAITTDVGKVVGWDADDNFIYSYEILDRADYLEAVLVFRIDPDTGEISYLGKAPATTYNSDSGQYLDFEPQVTGTAYLNGKLYAFTDAGMACTNLKTMEPLYSDSF